MAFKELCNTENSIDISVKLRFLLFLYPNWMLNSENLAWNLSVGLIWKRAGYCSFLAKILPFLVKFDFLPFFHPLDIHSSSGFIFYRSWSYLVRNFANYHWISCWFPYYKTKTLFAAAQEFIKIYPPVSYTHLTLPTTPYV